MEPRKSRTYPDWALKRIQELDLFMLKTFDAICREQGLVYFADGGTCLGAIRHGGFIPWDDDIDLGMPIDDYTRFVEHAEEWLPEGIGIYTPGVTEHYASLWTKLYLKGTTFRDEGALEAGFEQGIFIDIMPYIPLDGPVEEANKELARTELWQKVSYLKHMSYTNIASNASLRIPKMAACVVAHAVISVALSKERIFEHHVRAFPADASGAYWGNPCAMRPFPYRKEALFPVYDAPYCDMTIMMPHNPDEYLTTLYGDYMTLPAPEKRHTHMPAVLDFGDGTNVMEDGEKQPQESEELSSRKRIGIVTAYYPPHMGGVEQFSSRLATELASMGYAVSIITSSVADEEAYEMLPTGVEIFRLPCAQGANDRFPVLRAGRELTALRQVLEQDAYEGILVNTRFYSTTLFGLGLAKKCGVRPVLLDHGSSYIGFDNARIDWAVHAYERAMTSATRRYDPAYYGISQKSVEWLRNFNIQAQGVIHNAIDADEFRSCASKRSFKEELGISEDCLLVSFTGRLLVGKGVWKIMETAQELARQQARVHFVIAGDGPEREALEQACPPNVSLVGPLDRADVSALLQQSDVFLFPSDTEGLPTSVLEASSAGITTIATDVGGMREMFPDESYGIVYEDFDVHECAQQLLWYEQHRDVVRERGMRCCALVERDFAWESTARAVLDACARANE